MKGNDELIIMLIAVTYVGIKVDKDIDRNNM